MISPERRRLDPRGDIAGFVRVRDAKILLLHDRRGNNRIDGEDCDRTWNQRAQRTLW